jgi:hypothetical protein
METFPNHSHDIETLKEIDNFDFIADGVMYDLDNYANIDFTKKSEQLALGHLFR